MSAGLLRCVGVYPEALNLLRNLIKLQKIGLVNNFSHFSIVFLKLNQQISYLITNQSKKACIVNLGFKNVIRMVLNMENKRNYEKTRKILKDKIIRLMMEKNLTARALSIRIEKNEW